MKINSIIDLVKDLDTSRQTKNLNKLLIRILLHLQVEFSKQFLGNKVNPISPINREENIVMDSVKTDTAKLEQFQEEPKKQIVHPHPQSSSQPELPITDIREVRRENEERLFYSCQSVADYEEYLRKYPKGRFVHKAKRAIQQIESEMMQSNPSTQEIHIRKNTRVNVRL